MVLNSFNIIVISVSTIVILICSISIIIASRFQNKQKKKYNECLNIIKEKDVSTLQFKDALTKEEINNIDSEVDVDVLMSDLYHTYLEFENKVKSFDVDLDYILIGYLKDFYINKIENFKERGFSDITDDIDLINYSITEYSKEKLKFRINISCFCYKTVDNKIVSGSNLEKVQKVVLLTYEKNNNNWLISSYEKIYEKKLSD